MEEARAARIELTRIERAGKRRTEFAYDGQGRRVRQIEKTGDGTAWTVASQRSFVWCGMELCQERDATGGTVTSNYFAQGEERLSGGNSDKYYYTSDHLGSVREVADATGALVARYDYDVWGRRTQLSGTFNSERGFTGHWHHAWSNLIIAPFRTYDPDVGRWLSEDPIGEEGGINLYEYVGNKQLIKNDRSGMIAFTPADALIGAAAGAIIGGFAGGPKGALAGGLSGLVGGISGPGVLGNPAVLGFMAGSLSSLLNSLFHWGEQSPYEAICRAGVAGALGAGFGWAGGYILDGLKDTTASSQRFVNGLATFAGNAWAAIVDYFGNTANIVPDPRYPTLTYP